MSGTIRPGRVFLGTYLFVSWVVVVFPRFFRRAIVAVWACFGLVFEIGVQSPCFSAVQSICVDWVLFGEECAVLEHGLRVVDWAGIGRVMVFVARNGLENLTKPPGKDVGVAELVKS